MFHSKSVQNLSIPSQALAPVGQRPRSVEAAGVQLPLRPLLREHGQDREPEVGLHEVHHPQELQVGAADGEDALARGQPLQEAQTGQD